MRESGYVSESSYLMVEEAAKEKSEYVAGFMFAISGETVAHDRIVINLTLALGPHAKQSGCDLFTSDMKLKIKSLGVFYYPDLMVSCRNADQKAVFIEAPCLIVEVSSPSTRLIDLREKCLAYKCVESVQEYLIVDQDRKCVELCRRNVDNEWTRSEFGPKEVISLRSIGNTNIDIPVDEIYDRVLFD